MLPVAALNSHGWGFRLVPHFHLHDPMRSTLKTSCMTGVKKAALERTLLAGTPSLELFFCKYFPSLFTKKPRYTLKRLSHRPARTMLHTYILPFSKYVSITSRHSIEYLDHAALSPQIICILICWLHISSFLAFVLLLHLLTK